MFNATLPKCERFWSECPAIFLPPVLVAQLANHPREFRFHQGGRLRYLLLEAGPAWRRGQ
jgi:hypothetical protein